LHSKSANHYASRCGSDDGSLIKRCLHVRFPPKADISVVSAFDPLQTLGHLVASAWSPGDNLMRFHVSRALQGWRGFLKEYAIVVLGVLTALALDQAVASAHDRRLGKQAREAIHGELQDDLDRVAYRAEQSACNERRLNEIQALLSSWHSDDAFPAGLKVGFPGTVGLSDQRWQANLASGRFSEETPGEQADQAGLYTLIHVIDMIENKEIDQWLRLRTLELGSRSISLQSKPMIAEALSQARAEGEALKGLSAAFESTLRKAEAGRAALRPRAFPAAVLGSTCEPMRNDG
jgi:hypothetical protein